MYADSISNAMETAINETNRRRKIQEDFNNLNRVNPTQVVSEIRV